MWRQKHQQENNKSKKKKKEKSYQYAKLTDVYYSGPVLFSLK